MSTLLGLNRLRKEKSGSVVTVDYDVFEEIELPAFLGTLTEEQRDTEERSTESESEGARKQKNTEVARRYHESFA